MGNMEVTMEDSMKILEYQRMDTVNGCLEKLRSHTIYLLRSERALGGELITRSLGAKLDLLP